MKYFNFYLEDRFNISNLLIRVTLKYISTGYLGFKWSYAFLSRS